MTKEGYDEKIRQFVKNGGTFVTTFFSGYVDESDCIIPGGYPGRLRDILGLWVEEEDALPSGTENSFTYNDVNYPARLLCDLSHPEGAEILSVYDSDFYARMPVLTVNPLEKGKAYYVATRSNREFYEEFLKDLCEEAGIMSVAEPQKNLEATKRVNENGGFLFLLNHGAEEIQVELEKDGTELLEKKEYRAGDRIVLKAKDVKIIQEKQN